MNRKGYTIGVVSGKGGVGKSVVAVNLAETLAAQGLEVALVDADFGQGACAVLTNEAPRHTVLDAARHTAALEAVPHRTASGVTLVQAVAEPGQADRYANPLYDALDATLALLKRSHDIVLIDAGAGVDTPVRWTVERADMALLVLAGEPTAVADAYRLTKLVWQADPAQPVKAVVNFAETEAEARSIADRFAQITHHFLQQAPALAGWIPFTAEIRRSVMAQTPAVRTDGPVARAFAGLADTLRAGVPTALSGPLA